jgi:predicted enzyme related to lactoylglutathione lyase
VTDRDPPYGDGHERGRTKERPMLERDRYPAGVPCWIESTHAEPKEAADFYAGLFGWAIDDRAPAGADPYLVGTLRGRDVAAVGPRRPGAPEVTAWIPYVAADDADVTARRIVDAGGRILVEPADVPGAGRGGLFADRGGAVFGVWQATGRPGSVLVNEPGTWNFSELNTPDPDGATYFYGTVFGWEVTTGDLGTGDESGTFIFWRLPGYGDFLAERDPDLRERQATNEAPGGFEDAVAWLVPTTADQTGGDTGSHWSTTFAVADTDAVAARAAELGGTILVPPFDAGVVRMAVLADPQGATFTASKYQPEARAQAT